MKNILRYLSIFLTLVFLVGCAPKEVTKTYSKQIDAKLYAETTITYKEKSGVVDKQETRNTFSSVDKTLSDGIKLDYEKYKKEYNVEGFQINIEDKGSEISVIFSFDYTKADLDKLSKSRLVPPNILSDDKKSVSLEKIEVDLKEKGWQEKK